MNNKEELEINEIRNAAMVGVKSFQEEFNPTKEHCVIFLESVLLGALDAQRNLEPEDYEVIYGKLKATLAYKLKEWQEKEKTLLRSLQEEAKSMEERICTLSVILGDLQ